METFHKAVTQQQTLSSNNVPDYNTNIIKIFAPKAHFFSKQSTNLKLTQYIVSIALVTLKILDNTPKSYFQAT